MAYPVNSDPQKPEYDKPYCWKCQAHTAYKVITQTRRSESGTISTTTRNVCRDCDKTMHAPQSMDFAYYGKVGLGCAWGYFLVAIGCFLYALFKGRGIASSQLTHYLLVGGVVVVLIIGPAILLIRAVKKYTTWKVWANERGWEEPPAQERAWKKEGK